MSKKRKDDTEEKLRFRSKRLIEQHGKWFFHTREQTLEGPFPSQRAALNRLDEYIKLMNTGLVSSDDDFLKKWSKSIKSKDQDRDW